MSRECHSALLMSRPKRASASVAARRIRGVYEWEDCAESSEQFQVMATEMEQHFTLEDERAPIDETYESSDNASESSEDDGSYESSFVSKSGSERDEDSDLESDTEGADAPDAATAEAEAAQTEADDFQPWAPGPVEVDSDWIPGDYGPDAKRRRIASPERAEVLSSERAGLVGVEGHGNPGPASPGSGQLSPGMFILSAGIDDFLPDEPFNEEWFEKEIPLQEREGNLCVG